MENFGAICFGLVIGWITFRTLRRKEGTALSDIASVIGAVGGAGVTTIFGDKSLFFAYCIGLAIGFFAYFIVGLIAGKGNVDSWMMSEDSSGKL
jgi:uncharacterized membrane protein YeaQ/YmgE (transglycosylase-associated protein family)